MNWAALLAGIVTGAVAGSPVGWLVSKLIVRRERRRRTARTVAALQGSRPPVANLTPDSLVSVDVGGMAQAPIVRVTNTEGEVVEQWDGYRPDRLDALAVAA